MKHMNMQTIKLSEMFLTYLIRHFPSPWDIIIILISWYLSYMHKNNPNIFIFFSSYITYIWSDQLMEYEYFYENFHFVRKNVNGSSTTCHVKPYCYKENLGFFETQVCMKIRIYSCSIQTLSKYSKDVNVIEDE